MAIVVAMVNATTTKAEIEDVDLMVMVLILSNWLLVKVSKISKFRVRLSTFRIIPPPAMIWPFYKGNHLSKSRFETSPRIFAATSLLRSFLFLTAAQ